MLREVADMRKVYDVTFTVERAEGILGAIFAASRGTGELSVAGPEASFDDPDMRTFLLSLRVTTLVNAKGHDMLKYLPFTLVVEDVPWQYIDGAFTEWCTTALMEATINGGFTDDWTELREFWLNLCGHKLFQAVGLRIGNPIAHDVHVRGCGKLQENA
jgi:hypothetical protein